MAVADTTMANSDMNGRDADDTMQVMMILPAPQSSRFLAGLTGARQDYQDTPDYTVRVASRPLCPSADEPLQDSDTNPNTTASSVAGDAVPIDGRKRRAQDQQLRKSMFGRKHDRLGESKVGSHRS